MKIRHLLCAAALMAQSAAFAAVPKVFVYRNDGQFNAVEVGQGLDVVHSLDGANPGIRFSDELSVPFSVIDSCAVRMTDIPAVRISLTDYPEVTSLWDKELYLNAGLMVDGNSYIDDVAPIELKVKGRGNSTWTMPKKPMRLKFGKKIKIGNLTKAKNLVLLNNYIDPTLMKNSVMMWMADKFGVRYSNHALPCNVYLNEAYIGSYLMTEKWESMRAVSTLTRRKACCLS